MNKKLAVFVSFVSCLSLLASCAQTKAITPASSSGASNDPKKISIIDFSERTISFDQTPERIATLSNGEMDIIYALGGEVVGRPNGDTHIEAAESVEQIGSTHAADLERLTAVEPEVVLGNAPMNEKDIPTIEGIGSKMILTSANSVDDIKKQIDLFGELLEEEEKAGELKKTIDQKVKEVNDLQAEHKPRALLIYGAPGTNMAALPNSLSGNLLEVAGGENIAGDYPSLDSYPQYAQLNTEKIIESNPEIILLMTHGNPEEVQDSFFKEIKQNAGWSELDAIKNERFVVLPSDLFGTNPGTRVIEALDTLHEILSEIQK